MVSVVHKYYNSLDSNINEIFQNKFEPFFRQNIKNDISKKLSKKKGVLDIILRRNHKNKREIIINDKKYNFIMEIYDTSITGNIKINYRINRIGKGGFGSVFKTNIVSSNTKKLSNVLKIISVNKNNEGEFKSLIFNICLLAYLYITDNNGIKYFCDLYEFGELKKSFYQFTNNGKNFYALMENGGNELAKITFTQNQDGINYKLKEVLSIIKECANAILVLHDIGILHCDIKLQNFLYKKKR